MKLMKETGTLLRRDLLLGFHHLKYRLLLSVLFILLSISLTIYQISQLALLNKVSLSAYTATNLVFMLFRGVDYQVLNNPEISFPFSWLILLIICPFIIGSYLREDLYNQASILFIRTQSRLSLWLSKLLFCCFVVIAIYFLYLVLLVLATYFFLSFSADWSTFGNSMIHPLIAEEMTTTVFSMHVFLLPLLTSLSLGIIHGVLTLFIRPIYALFAILAALIVSVYSSSFLFPGSYSMILRHKLFDLELGFSWSTAIIYLVVIVGLASVVGYAFFNRMDIIQKEEE